MRIYADICTLCRPFDDQTQSRIWLETHALCVLLSLVESGQIDMVRSPIHDLENSRNSSAIRRSWVEKCLGLAHHQVSLSPAIRSRALELEAIGVKALDALHASAAEAAVCGHLLTCDDRFRKSYTGSLSILNPADFVVEYFHQTP